MHESASLDGRIMQVTDALSLRTSVKTNGPSETVPPVSEAEAGKTESTSACESASAVAASASAPASLASIVARRTEWQRAKKRERAEGGNCNSCTASPSIAQPASTPAKCAQGD